MRRRLGAASVLSFTIVAGACGDLAERESLPPEGQIVLGVSTDAWLPRGPDGPSEPFETSPLFERLRVEFFAPGETEPCHDCLRDFGIDTRTVNEGKASVGFLPKKGVFGYRARVSIYHSGSSESYAEPRPRSTIEVVVALPPVSAEGVVRVHVVLRTDDLGRPRGTLDAPVAAEAGPPPLGLAGSWSSGVRRSCPEPAGKGEACVPGGAFWQGDPSFSQPFERLTAISPFYLDAHEVTVADLRASGVAAPDDPTPQSGTPATLSHYCTWTTDEGSNEELPINCLSRPVAEAHCKKLGRRLPTDAEIEFAAGARRDATFPWGETTPACADAVYGRDWDTTRPADFRACLGNDVEAGVAKPGTGRLDRVTMPDGTEILDLVGNVTEWVQDELTELDEPCHEENPAIDPACTVPSKSAPRLGVTRGTSWAYLGGPLLRAAYKSGVDRTKPNERTGFRCARDAK